MDFIDSTLEREDRLRDLRIQAIRNAKPELQAKGKCHYCEAPVKQPKLFCNGECASEYELCKKANRH